MAKLNPAPIQAPVVDGSKRLTTIWAQWFNSMLLGIIRADGSVRPVTLADADAENNSIYYSSTASKLVYKDSGGVVNNLY